MIKRIICLLFGHDIWENHYMIHGIQVQYEECHRCEHKSVFNIF